MERRRTEVGDAVQHCLRETSEAWFSEHAGLRSREEAYHTDVKTVTGCFEIKPGGILEVTVSVNGKTREQIRTDWYPYIKRGKLGYVRREPTKKS